MKKIDLSSVIKQKRAKTALWLIQNSANIDIRNADNDTPLIFAAVSGLTDVVKALIDKKNETKGDLSAYLNHKNKFGQNALLLALDRKHQDTALARINAGADIHVANP